MNSEQFKEYISSKIIILDGATGTELQKRGMPAGVCPEQWVCENPDAIKSIQSAYVNAGSDIIYTCTFGGNRIKLEEFGLGGRTFEINRRLAQFSREAAGSKCLVAGDLASTGRFVKPLGDLPFEECVNIYKEQVKGLLEGGVDLFVIETMLDIQEARAALLAVKESCDLPVCVSMSFDESKTTLTGTDPVTALITLQSLGADAVGCNCSTGPSQMVEIIKMMKPFAKVPLIAKPNAGLPKLINGTTVFDMGPEEFANYAEELVRAGVNLLGGCCGTSPLYIEQIYRHSKNLMPQAPHCKPYSAVTSSRKAVFFGFNEPVAVVGERINPTGKKKLQAELKDGLTHEVKRFAFEQIEKGAQILDVNVGMPGIDEKETMTNIVSTLAGICDAPLCLDSSSPEVLEAALRIYPGRALINSISQEKNKLDKLLPVAAKYGAMFILLPLSDEGVPEKAVQRKAIVQKVFEEAARYGYQKSDIVVDGLVMTVSSNQEAALETLNLIEWCSREFGCGTIVGLSNVSFGLPERSWVNAAFLAMAIGRGLTMAIANPSSDLLMCIKMACDVITANDANCSNYIAYFNSQNKALPGEMPQNAEDKKTGERIYDAVLKGDKEGIGMLIEKALEEKVPPQDIVDQYLIPAINQVGKLFDEKKYFLPQLIQSAETMKAGFAFIEPKLKKSGEGHEKEDVIILMATVKGDIHDIGKNIVSLMLRNYGFKVYDLGKDVSAEVIVEEAKLSGAHIIGLSALMTTTMVEMKEVIKLAKEVGLDCRFMIGGAVVDEGYARQIGADGYSKDAYEAVKLAQRLSRDILKAGGKYYI
ncbi:MAG: homocysteine S-methyltransferase family protein [Clostridia bacterium]|nr:homocysteine S-methyltransferase family protein [Clostridia bacterium]